MFYFLRHLRGPAHQIIRCLVTCLLAAATQVRLGQSCEEFLREDDKIADSMGVVADLLTAAAKAAAAPAPSPTSSEQVVPVPDQTENTGVTQPGPDVDEDHARVHY